MGDLTVPSVHLWLCCRPLSIWASQLSRRCHQPAACVTGGLLYPDIPHSPLSQYSPLGPGQARQLIVIGAVPCLAAPMTGPGSKPGHTHSTQVFPQQQGVLAGSAAAANVLPTLGSSCFIFHRKLLLFGGVIYHMMDLACWLDVVSPRRLLSCCVNLLATEIQVGHISC